MYRERVQTERVYEGEHEIYDILMECRKLNKNIMSLSIVVPIDI